MKSVTSYITHFNIWHVRRPTTPPCWPGFIPTTWINMKCHWLDCDPRMTALSIGEYIDCLKLIKKPTIVIMLSWMEFPGLNLKGVVDLSFSNSYYSHHPGIWAEVKKSELWVKIEWTYWYPLSLQHMSIFHLRTIWCQRFTCHNMEMSCIATDEWPVWVTGNVIVIKTENHIYFTPNLKACVQLEIKCLRWQM